MSEMMIQPEDLRGAAEQFELAGKDMAEILQRLDETTGDLQNKWAGVSKQVFYKEYGKLRQYMDGYSHLLAYIAVEMQAMADRFEKADN